MITETTNVIAINSTGNSGTVEDGEVMKFCDDTGVGACVGTEVVGPPPKHKHSHLLILRRLRRQQQQETI